jgi:hypothetical protein
MQSLNRKCNVRAVLQTRHGQAAEGKKYEWLQGRISDHEIWPRRSQGLGGAIFSPASNIDWKVSRPSAAEAAEKEQSVWSVRIAGPAPGCGWEAADVALRHPRVQGQSVRVRPQRRGM